MSSLSTNIVLHLMQEMTLKEIGKLAGLSESYISLVKSGQRNFTVDRLERIEKATKTPIPVMMLESIDPKKVHPSLKKKYTQLKKIIETELE